MDTNRYLFSVSDRKYNFSPTNAFKRKSSIRPLMLNAILATVLIGTAGSASADPLQDKKDKDSPSTLDSPDLGKSLKNPVLENMRILHPLGEKYANPNGDLTGDGVPEQLRIDDNGTLIVIEDNQGNILGAIKQETPVQGASIADIDSNGLAEVLVLSEGLHRMRAYDHYGNHLEALDQRAIALAENYYKLAMERSLDNLHDQPANIEDFPPPGYDPVDEEYCSDANRIEWDGVTKDWKGRPLIEGTTGDDVISGTYWSDTIIGYGGNDVICGRGGDDWLYGDIHKFDPVYSEVDTSSGNLHIDFIYGGSGDDILFGGVDSDFLFGGDGNDTLFGGLGDDQLQGDQYGFISYPNASTASWNGQDFLVGMWGDDFVSGGPGHDTVNATAFDDVETESSFDMFDEYYDDNCHVHVVEAVFAIEGQCENVYITDW